MFLFTAGSTCDQVDQGGVCTRHRLHKPGTYGILKKPSKVPKFDIENV